MGREWAAIQQAILEMANDHGHSAKQVIERWWTDAHDNFVRLQVTRKRVSVADAHKQIKNDPFLQAYALAHQIHLTLEVMYHPATHLKPVRQALEKVFQLSEENLGPERRLEFRHNYLFFRPTLYPDSPEELSRLEDKTCSTAESSDRMRAVLEGDWSSIEQHLRDPRLTAESLNQQYLDEFGREIQSDEIHAKQQFQQAIQIMTHLGNTVNFSVHKAAQLTKTHADDIIEDLREGKDPFNRAARI